MASRSLSATGLPPVRIDLSYNYRKDLAGINRYTDLAGTQLVGMTAITVDDAHRVTKIAHKNAAGATLSNYADAFDPGDRLTSENWVSGANSGSRNFGYDTTNQLTSDGTSNWSFDLNGNRTVSGYQTGVANRLLSDGTWNYGYDDEGNMISKSRIGGNEVWTFGYDHLNHLISITQVVNGVTQLTINYTYDIFGQRIQESKWKPSTGTVVTRFAYANGILYADLDGSNNVLVRYVLGDEVDQLLARLVACGPNAGVAFYLTDRLGSVRDLMDTSQVIRDHLDYDGFGNCTVETSPSFGDRLKFTSREYDPDTGLYYNRARYYNPSTGRWISDDPLGFAAGDSNLGRYTGNEPSNATDPRGLKTIPVEYPFNDKEEVVLNVTAEMVAQGQRLKITVQQGPKFRTYSGRFSFFGVIDGSEKTYKDTDSAQVAVRWTDKNGKEVGHATNAKSAATARGSKPNAAAKWDRDKQEVTKGLKTTQLGEVSWQTGVPKGATHLDVIVLYTDLLFGNPAKSGGKRNNYGDLPAVIGSFSADLKNGKWQIDANWHHLFDLMALGNLHDDKYFTKLEKIESFVENARKVLKRQTGYELEARPVGLDGVFGPSKEYPMREIQKYIALAAGWRLINNENDTGFDIVPRK